ncbi:MAG: hypothetical protein WDW38_005590 [Sanguina aurantia]
MATPEVQALLSGSGNFDALIVQLQSADNDLRKGAEEIYEQLKDQADVCFQYLMQHLRASPSEESRQFCGILLRKVITKEGGIAYWAKCSPAVQALVKVQLLKGLIEEPSKIVVKRICDCVSELGAIEIDEPGWPELLPTLFQCVASANIGMQVSALSVFGDLAMYVGDSLKPQLPQLVQVLSHCLNHADSDIQLASLRAVASFIEALEEPSDRDKFSPMLPSMLAVLGSTLNSGDEASAQEVLSMLIQVAEAHPRFLRRQLNEIVTAMLSVARAGQLEANTRTLAAEFLVTLCEAREKAPGMMRKMPTFGQQLFETLMLFLLDIEAGDKFNYDYRVAKIGKPVDRSDWGMTPQTVNAYYNAQQNEIVFPAAILLPPFFDAKADDGINYGGIGAVIGERGYPAFEPQRGCAKVGGDGAPIVAVMAGQLSVLVDMCVTGLSDPHPKVRWAACQAIGQMCTDLGPDMQNSQHAKILPALMRQMDDFENPRVQAHASAAVVNFSESVDAELLPPYLDILITKLLLLLQHGKKVVQEGALTAMASVADNAQSLFAKYYDTVMPLLYAILTSASDKEHRMLRAKALECISLVGVAVGKERFREDARQMMLYLQQLQQTQLDADDPTIGYMLQAGARLCKCLGQEFIPYLDIVMPPLLKSAQLEPDIKVREADDEEDEDDLDEDVEVIPLGDKTLTIRTSALEEKATACNMLCCYAEELKEGFLPWMRTVADIMVPLLKFWFHEDVRRAAVQALPELLNCCVQGVAKGVAGVDAGIVAALLEFMWEPLMEALGKEPEPSVIASILDSIVEIVEMVDPQLLKQEWVKTAFERFAKVLVGAEERRQERQKRQAGEDFDEEELETLEEENEIEEELFDQVGTCVGCFLKKFGDAVLPYVEEIMALIAPLLAKGRGNEERRIAICVVDDLLEHSPAGRAKYLNQVLPILLECSSSEAVDLRQCAVYGLGILALKSPAQFKPAVPDALARVLAIVRHADARNDDNEMCHDNAVSTLGKLWEHHSELMDVGAVAAVWVAALPLLSDAIEAQAMHEMLARMLEASDPRVLGPNNAHLPHLAAAIVTVLGHGLVLVAGEVGGRLAVLLHRLQPSVPGEGSLVKGGLTPLRSRRSLRPPDLGTHTCAPRPQKERVENRVRQRPHTSTCADSHLTCTRQARASHASRQPHAHEAATRLNPPTHPHPRAPCHSSGSRPALHLRRCPEGVSAALARLTPLQRTNFDTYMAGKVPAAKSESS